LKAEEERELDEGGELAECCCVDVFVECMVEMNWDGETHLE
jgi:hypothetical protein